MKNAIIKKNKAMIKNIQPILSLADIALNIHATENGSIRIVLSPIPKKTYPGDSGKIAKEALSKALVITGSIEEVDSKLTEILQDFTTKYATAEQLVSHSLTELAELEKSLKDKKASAIQKGAKLPSKEAQRVNPSTCIPTLNTPEEDLFAANIPKTETSHTLSSLEDQSQDDEAQDSLNTNPEE